MLVGILFCIVLGGCVDTQPARIATTPLPEPSLPASQRVTASDLPEQKAVKENKTVLIHGTRRAGAELTAKIQINVSDVGSIVECWTSPAFLPARLGGEQQALVLTTGDYGICLSLFPLVRDGDHWLPGPMPLFQFTGLGERLMPFKNAAGQEILLFMGDLTGNSLIEFGILGFAQPNSALTLKRFNAQQGAFEDIEFRPEEKTFRHPIVVSLDETLQIPASLKRPFVVTNHATGKVRVYRVHPLK